MSNPKNPQTPKNTKHTVTGTVTQVEKNALMQVTIGDKTISVGNRVIKAKLKGSLYKNRIKVMLGDTVKVQMVPNSETHYIVRRL